MQNIPLKLVEVPPPDAAPEFSEAKELGILSCLHVYKDNDQFRCCECGRMQQNGSIMVMISDGVHMGDPEWAIMENARRNLYNGHFSGWCLHCAKKLTKLSGAKIKQKENSPFERSFDKKASSNLFQRFIRFWFWP